MYRPLLLSLLFLTHSAETHCQEHLSIPSFSSGHFSLIDIITTIEIPFLIGLTAPSWPLFAAFGHNPPVQVERLFAQETAQCLFGMMSISGLVLAHTECLKGFLYSQKHRVNISSIFSKQPQHCLYQLTIKLNRLKHVSEKNQTFYITRFSEAKKFENLDPRKLIDEVTNYVKTWTNEHTKEGEDITVDLTPTLLLERGKPFHFKTQSLLWNEHVGIERTLRETLLVGKNLSPQSATTTFGYSLACATIGLAGHLFLRTTLS